MRVRKKKWTDPFIKAHKSFIINDSKACFMKNKWVNVFKNQNPIYLEIGSGKGKFLFGNALLYPKINFIGLETQKTPIAIGARRIFFSHKKLNNVRLILGNASNLKRYFSSHEIKKIFLNHSDPWPKTRHEKRRLTSSQFLKLYHYLLPRNGEIELKTDNLGFFEYSLYNFSKYNFSFSKKEISYDLHHELGKKIYNIKSEYEEKFENMGMREFWVKVHNG